MSQYSASLTCGAEERRARRDREALIEAWAKIRPTPADHAAAYRTLRDAYLTSRGRARR